MMARTRMTRIIGSLVVIALALSAIVAASLAAQEATPTVEQPVVIANIEITWTGPWEYDQSGSYSVAELPDQAIFSQSDDAIDDEIEFVKILTHGMLEDESVSNTTEAIDLFAELFLEGASALGVQQSNTGELENGATWSVYTLTPSASDDLQGQSVASLISASQNDDGAYVVTSLTSTTDVFETSITQVQNDFTIDGEGQLFEGIDAAEAAADLPESTSPAASGDATPLASPEIIVVGSPEASPVGSPGVIPVAGPDATPLGDAEATLAAIQNLADEGTPAD